MQLFFISVLVVMMVLSTAQLMISLHTPIVQPSERNVNEIYESEQESPSSRRKNKIGPFEIPNINVTVSDWKRILYYNPGMFQDVRGVRNLTSFRTCPEKRCTLEFSKSYASISDAVMLDMRRLKNPPNFYRPKHQIWILVQHEASWRYNYERKNMMNNFNWTMTYSKDADIPLPYGKLIPSTDKDIDKRDYLAIAKKKTKDAIWIVSSCHTNSRREDYVEVLKKYINVDVLGDCGKEWNCGERFVHDHGNCFSILNSTYRFHIAFENSLCEDYITEKFYENYKYDIIQVVRGGNLKNRPVIAARGAYISTTDFTNAHLLGQYLQQLSERPTQYAQMLKEKDKYMSTEYTQIMKDAMCEICYRLHNLDDYRNVYDNVRRWMTDKEPCYQPNDVY